MEYLNKVKDVLKLIKTYFLVVCVLILLVVVKFKNDKIFKQGELLNAKPKIEIVYNHQRDTIKGDSIPVPYEIVKWKPSETDTMYLPSELDYEDTVSISEAYSKLYGEYASIKKYDSVLKDDTLAYIRLKESTQYNSIFGRELIFESRTPTVYITQPPKHIYTSSIVGGIEAGTGGVSVGVGLVTKKNSVYQFSYDPYNKISRGSIYLSLFNFRK